MSNRWESPIARLKMDNNVLDAYGSYNGTASNVTYGTTTPKEGSHYSILNGTTAKVTLNSLDVQALEFFTISFWVNGSAAQAYQHFYSQGNSANDQLYYRLLCSDGTGLCALDVKGAGGVLISQYGNKVVLDGSWHLVTLTDNSGTPTLYVDGVKDTGLTNTYAYEDISLNQTSIGVLSRTSDADFMAASFDDFRVYNYVLTSAEVRNLYLSYDRQALWNYISRWKFDADGTDSGPKGYTMSATGSPPFRPGVNGRCAELDGSTQYWSAAHTTQFQFGTTQDFTITWWEYPNGITGNPKIVHNWLDNGWMITSWEASILVQGFSGNRVITRAINIGEWSFCAMSVTRASAINVYKNGLYTGQYAGATTGTTATPTPGGTMSIGCKSTDFTEKYNGKIEDLRVYEYALSATDIKQLYQSYHGQYPQQQGTIV